MNTRNLLSFTTLFIVFLTFATTASATVRSCDSLSYSSNSDQFSGDQLTCAFTSDFATDAIQLDLSQTDLSNQIPNGQADQSLEFSVTKQTSNRLRLPQHRAGTGHTLPLRRGQRRCPLLRFGRHQTGKGRTRYWRQYLRYRRLRRPFHC